MNRKLELAALAAMLLLAGILRMGWPGINLFDYDQARVSQLALQMARQGQVAQLGIVSSIGLPNFPASVWVFALPYGFSTDPLLASQFVGALGTLAVAGQWWLARRLWPAPGALVATLLFAASPYVVFYSRDIWTQDLLMPLAVAWAMTGIVGVSRRATWALALHVFLAGFVFQVHYAGFVLIPATLWLGLRYRLWRDWRALLIGGGLAGLCAWPFIQAIGCCVPTFRVTVDQWLAQPVQVDLKALTLFWQMGIGVGWDSLLLGPAWKWVGPLAIGIWLSQVMVSLGLVFGSLALIRQTTFDPRTEPSRDGRGVALTLLPAWAFVGPALFVSHRADVNPQYLLASLPALFLIMGGSLGAFPARGWRTGVVMTAMAIALVQSSAWSYAITRISRERLAGGVGTPLSQPRAVAQALRDGQRIVAHTFGDEPEFFGDVAMFHVLLWEYPHQVVDGRSVLLIPSESAHLLVASPELPVWEEIRALGLTGAPREFPRREGEPAYVAIEAQQVVLENFQAVEPVTLANGAQLIAWQTQPIHQRLRVTTLWKIIAPTPGGAYHQFHHLYHTQSPGSPPQIQDVAVSSAAWQAGDQLVVWADFDPPASAGPWVVDVGMYLWPALERSPALDRAGDALAPIRLGPFEFPPTDPILLVPNF